MLTCDIPMTHNNDRPEAVQAFRRKLDLDQDDFQAWNNLGHAYIKLKQNRRAFYALKEATKYEYQNWKVWDNICGVSRVSHHPTGIFPSRGPQMGCHHDHSRNMGLWVVCRYLPPVPPLVGSQLPPPFMHYAEQVLWLQLTTHDVIIGHWSIPGHNYRGKQSS